MLSSSTAVLISRKLLAQYIVSLALFLGVDNNDYGFIYEHGCGQWVWLFFCSEKVDYLIYLLNYSVQLLEPGPWPDQKLFGVWLIKMCVAAFGEIDWTIASYSVHRLLYWLLWC